MTSRSRTRSRCRPARATDRSRVAKDLAARGFAAHHLQHGAGDVRRVRVGREKYVGGRKLLGLRGAATVYDVDSLGGLHRLPAPDSSSKALVEDAIAYFQTADELYRNGAYRFDRQASASANAVSPTHVACARRAEWPIE